MKKIIAVLVLSLFITNTAYASIPEGHWFAEYKDGVAALNIYADINSESFDPDATVTYSAFARIATIALGRLIAYNTDYAQMPIPRGKVLTIMIERLNYSPDMVTDEMKTKTETEIADFDQINATELSSVIIAYNNGIIIGDADKCVNTNEHVTYAEALIMCYRIMNK